MASKKKTEKNETEKTTKKNTAKKSTEVVDSASQMFPDEVGLVMEEQENRSTDEFTQLPDDPEVVFENVSDIEPEDGKFVEGEQCEEEPVTDHQEEEVYKQETNQELDIPEPMFKPDDVMVNDITNILNGLDGVRANRIGEEPEKEAKKPELKPETKINTEEKNYYSDQFSRSWGGVMYDI